MKYELDISDKVEAYLDGLLPDAEKQEIETLLKQDPEFASYVKGIKKANDVIHFSGLAELRKQIGTDVKKVPYTKGKVSPYVKNGTIALLIGIIGSTIYLTTGEQETSTSSYHKEEEQIIEFIDKKPTPSTTSDNEIPEKTDSPTTVGKKENAPTQEGITPLNEAGDDKAKDEAGKENETTTEELKETTVSATPLTPVVANCDRDFTVVSTETCPEQSEGVVEVFTDGTTSYSFKLKETQQTSADGTFKNLEAGTYTIQIAFDGCFKTTNAVVEEKWCPVNKDQSFNPTYGEKWTPDYQEGDYGTFSIYSGTGKKIYQGKFGNEKGYWDGTNMDGEEVPLGNYIVKMEYFDGRVEKIQLTVIK